MLKLLKLYLYIFREEGKCLSFILETYKKLQNKGKTKNLRHSAWLDRSVFQSLKTLVIILKPYSKRHTSNPYFLADFSFAQGRAKVKLGGACWRSLILTFHRQLIMEKDPNATNIQT